MKRTTLFLCLLAAALSASAQIKPNPKKYPSILWEITGNGLKKPSYLIGTMHVSSKIAFNLPDSFFIAVKNAQVVALETNPETWQEDMRKYDMESGGGQDYTWSKYLRNEPDDYLHASTLRFYKYYGKIERSLFSNPSMINNLLYRTYGNESSDFEEDTYLDMYIYQCGKKWGKSVAGVENYAESMRLMAEAYKDAAKDKKRKNRSYGDMDDEYSFDKLQEAYKKGDLDLLDSINVYNSFSAAFDEKFLYKRNEIQASSIDSILKTGSSLFVGVGAAHLPGDRGVIELLRKNGYKLRPVKMGERASKTKELVDKIRVPVTFNTVKSDDGFYKVDIPGKFYETSEDPALDQRQYADMANGSYYMVTRIQTNAWLWNHSPDDVVQKVDSLLYENVPGKIITKTAIIRNGYKGFDITNRTRRGDLQRYNILITPFEILFFKMSGNGDYVSGGEEAKKFFGSIQLQEYKNTAESGNRYLFTPPGGGFTVELPHAPYTGNDGSWIWDAADQKSGTWFRVIRSDIHNYNFTEEDTFDLTLMEESYISAEYYDTTLSRKQTTFKGYPALDASYRDKDGRISKVKYLIQGPHYYTLIAHAKQETPEMDKFMQSFALTPFQYGPAKPEKDTSLYFSVRTPVFPKAKKIKLDMPRYGYYGNDDDDDGEETEAQQLESGALRDKVIENDTTGEKIYVTFRKTSRYEYDSDSSWYTGKSKLFFNNDSTWILRNYTTEMLPSGHRVWNILVSDSGSSRLFRQKVFYKDGVTFTLTSQGDTLTPPSDFIKEFYSGFTPVDTLKGTSPFTKKSAVFFADLTGSDSIMQKTAYGMVDEIFLDSTDLQGLKNVIKACNWEQKKYLDNKELLISKLSDIKTKEAADYLKELYVQAGDTVQLQYAALEALLLHQRAYSIEQFRAIVANEPPVLERNASTYRYPGLFNSYFSGKNFRFGESRDGEFMDNLSDSLQLARSILPDLLPLLNLEDYKEDIMKLLAEMADSNLLKPADYEAYYSKFLLEAKLELRKQAIAEKKQAIRKAEESKKDNPDMDRVSDDEDEGNDDLGLYTTLLLPFWDTKPAVPALINQMLASTDKKLKYNTLIELIRKKRPYPDTLLKYFAAMDEYRYTLYYALQNLDQSDKFPSGYRNHIDLGKSELISLSSYNKPDSIDYIDRLPMTYKGKSGYIYFFRCKIKKDDLSWKLAVAGLVPPDEKQYSFPDTLAHSGNRRFGLYFPMAEFNRYTFTRYLDEKVAAPEGLRKQLNTELKKLLYERRRSAAEFYGRNNGGYNESVISRYIR